MMNDQIEPFNVGSMVRFKTLFVYDNLTIEGIGIVVHITDLNINRRYKVLHLSGEEMMIQGKKVEYLHLPSKELELIS